MTSATLYRVATHLDNLEKSGNSNVVREKSGKIEKNQGKVSLYSPTTTDTSTDTGVIHCVILHLLQPQCIKCQILKAHWLPGPLLINVKQRLLTIAFSSISMNLYLPYWKSQGISYGLESGHPGFTIWAIEQCNAINGDSISSAAFNLSCSLSVTKALTLNNGFSYLYYSF